MSTPLNNSAPGDAQRLRQDLQLHQSVDAEGNPVIEPVECKSISVCRGGCIESVQISSDRWYHCGCNANLRRMGGICGEKGCHRVSCERCFSRCRVCAKPLCSECATQVEVDGQRAVYCQRCLSALRRRRGWRRFARVLLAPFVEFGREAER